MVGLGIFAVAVVVVGAVLLLNGDDEDPNVSSLAADATATGSGSVVQTATAGLNTPSVTTEQQGASPTGAPNSTPAPAQGQATATGAGDDAGDDAEGTPEPAPELPSTATPEGTDDGEPTEEPTVSDEPTAEPPSGDFGTLPAADVPSGGLGRDLVLTYDLAIGSGDLPVEATVYHMLWEPHTAESASALATNLGITGEVTGGDGSFHVTGPEGTLSINGQSVQYLYGGKVPPVDLEDDGTLIAAAADWLTSNGLVLNDLGAGSVLGRDELGARVSVVFYSTDPETLLSVYPSARLTLGPGGTVLEAYVIWPTGYESSVYGLRSLDDVMGDLYDGRAYYELDLSAVPGDGPLSGAMTISSASIAYSTAGSTGSGQYLAPVFVLSGQVTFPDSGVSVPISVYVPAVYAQDSPRG